MGLLPVRFTVWGDINFIDMSGQAQPFEDFIDPLQQRWQSFDLSLLRQSALI